MIFLFSIGNHLEVKYDLLYYGIPVEVFPVDSTGKCDTYYHKSWVEQRRFIERGSMLQHSSQSNEMVDSDSQILDGRMSLPGNFPPMATAKSKKRGKDEHDQDKKIISKTPVHEILPNDCLLGRGKEVDQYKGNVRFRNYIKNHPTLVLAYATSPKAAKPSIVDQLCIDMQQVLNIRFLKKKDQATREWVLAPPDEVRAKVSRALRREVQRQQEQQEKKQQLHTFY